MTAFQPAWLSKRTYIVALSVVVLLGALVRWAGLDFGQPFALHPDEYVNEGLAYAAYDIDWSERPKFEAYPPALGNQMAVVARLFFDERPDLPTMRYLGRCVVWFVSVLGILFAGVAAQLIAGSGAGLLAASMVAFSPLIVEQSRYATTDGPTGAFVALVALCGFWIYRRPGWLPYVLSGVAVGLAASYKYAGAWSGLFLLVAHLGSPVRWRVKFWLLLVAAGALSLVVFVALNFQIAMDPGPWWERFLYQYRYYEKSHGGFTSDHTWIHAAHYTCAYGLGWGVSVACVAAAVWVCVRTRLQGQAAALGCLAVGVVYLVLLGLKPVFLARNLVHTLPMVCIGLAVLVASLPSDTVRRRGAAVAIGIVALLGVAHDAFLVGRHAWVLSRPDTRVLAANWMRDHIPREASVAGVGGKYYLPPAALSGINLSVERTSALPQVQRKGFQYLVLSSGTIHRYQRDPDHYPKITRTLQRDLARLRQSARSLAVFDAPQGPGGHLFGSTVDIYHNPHIEIFELPAARNSSQ